MEPVWSPRPIAARAALLRRELAMHAPGLVPLLIVLLLAFLLFGRPGRLSGLMEDLGKGIKGFRRGLGEKEEASGPREPAEPPLQVRDQSSTQDQTRTQDRTGA